VKRHGASGYSNDCMAVPLGGYSASNFAGSALSRSAMLYEASGQQARQAAPVGSAAVAQGAKYYDAWRTTADKEHAVFSLDRQKRLCYLNQPT